MNGAEIHMLFNHLPVIGFVGLVPALAVALVLKSVDIKRFVLLATVVVGASAMAAGSTGDGAEDVAKHLPGVTKAKIHAHEEMADKATPLALLTAAAAGAVFFLQRKRPGALNAGLAGVLVLSIASAVVMGVTAHEGGKIRHPEIDAAAAIGAGQPATAAPKSADDDHD